MSSNRIEVEKIVIKIGAKKLELTPREAEELRDVLNDVLKQKLIIGKDWHWAYQPTFYPPHSMSWTLGSASGASGTLVISKNMAQDKDKPNE